MTAGMVTVGADLPSYGQADALTITVANGLADDIRVADHQSGCSLVAVERLDGAMWRMQHPCPLRSPTRLITLAAGEVTALRIPPPASGWATGAYRATLHYRRADADDVTTLHSTQFTVA